MATVKNFLHISDFTDRSIYFNFIGYISVHKEFVG